MYCLCTHNNYTKRYTDSHADTRTYRQAIGQAQCRQSHTDRRLPWAIHCTDWLYATCVDYSKSKINDIYTEVISFFSVVIDTYQSQFVVNVDRWSLICLYFVSHRQLLEKAGKSRWALCVCVCIYSVSFKNHSITTLCQFYVCVHLKKGMVFSKVYIYCCMIFFDFFPLQFL